MYWKQEIRYLYGLYKIKNNKKNEIKMAGFDLDHTLIKPKNNKVRYSSFDDWIMYSDQVIYKLRSYVNEGFTFVIYSNQMDISRGKIDPKKYMDKIEAICKKINLPCIVLVSTSRDEYRKPFPNLVKKFINYGKESFFCGDAGGIGIDRIFDNIKLRKDFSDSDRKLALNLNIKFIHRDEFIFDGNCELPELHHPTNEIIHDFCYNIPTEKKNVIINVGPPASGKSSLSKYLQLNYDYQIVNMDNFKTKKKCMVKFDEYLQQGCNIVIDNTNPNSTTRKEYITKAKKYGYDIICNVFTCSRKLCNHNNTYRHITSKYSIDHIPEIAYRMYYKRFDDPTITEGFDYIINIKPFRNIEDEDYYTLWYP